MRKTGLILLFSLFASVLLIVGAGSAIAIVLTDHTGPGKSTPSTEPAPTEISEMTFQQCQQLLKENDIEIYYCDFGDPQEEYISSYSSTSGYYTDGGDGQNIYQDAFDSTEISFWLSFYFHMREGANKGD